MLLNENNDPNNRSLSKLQKGDKFVVQPSKGEKEYSFVQLVNGNEILLMTSTGGQGKNRSGYRIYSNNAIEGDILYFFPGNSKSKGKIQFSYIFVMDRSDNFKFTIEPVEPEEESEEDENLTPEEKKVREVLDNERDEIYSQFADIAEGDEFTMMFGDVEEDEDGNYTGQFKEKTNSQAYFRATGIWNNILLAELSKVEGAMSGTYDKFIGQTISFNIHQKGLFNMTNNGVSIRGYTNDKNEVYFQFVYYFNVQEEEDEDSSSIMKPKPKFNKDLMRLIHHRTWKDKFFGRDGKGIVPLEKIQQKYLSGSNKDKKYVKFMLDTEVKVGTGKNLYIKKNSETFGKRYDSGRIIVYGKNGKQTIHIFLKNTQNPNIYTVKIEFRDTNNEKHFMGTGKLTMID